MIPDLNLRAPKNRVWVDQAVNQKREKCSPKILKTCTMTHSPHAIHKIKVIPSANRIVVNGSDVDGCTLCFEAMTTVCCASRLPIVFYLLFLWPYFFIGYLQGRFVTMTVPSRPHVCYNLGIIYSPFPRPKQLESLGQFFTSVEICSKVSINLLWSNEFDNQSHASI